MKDNNKPLIISTIAITLLIIIVIGATYAYFKAQTGDTGNVPTQVTTNTTDSLVFETGANISITADTTTFAEGMDNRTGESFARATLKANNKTNSAKGNYYVYFDVTKNELTYTTETKKPELLLKITKTLGNNTPEEVTTGIEGVEYKNVTDGKGNSISGFDITEYTGLLTIVNNKEITSTSETVEKYDIEVILVNLNDDQTANGGKSFAGSLKIQTDEIPYHLACKSGTFACDIAKTYTGSQGTNNIYYHKNLENSAEDGSYRYAGANPSNYVCFGTEAADCDNDHLYRIIGVFGNQVKLIKADFATTEQLGTSEKGGDDSKSNFPNYKGSLTTIPTYYWSGSSSNKVNSWASSTLNTNALNKVFLGTFDATWQKRIATTNWKVGGNTYALIRKSNAQTAYINEIINPATGQTAVNNRIGLMYVSDYMFAASPTYWTYPGYNSDATTDYRAAIGSNWMYSGIYEWTISRDSDDTYGVFVVIRTGYVDNDGVYNNYHGVHPTFYLESNVKKIGGIGTQSDPYRIS